MAQGSPPPEPTEEFDFQMPCYNDSLVGCCLVRALLLNSRPAVGRLPQEIRAVAEQGLLGYDINPSGWAKVVRSVRYHHSKQGHLLKTIGALQAPVPNISFMICQLGGQAPDYTTGWISHRPVRELVWSRSLPHVAWILAHRIDDTILAGRQPNTDLCHLISKKFCVFDDPMTNKLLP